MNRFQKVFYCDPRYDGFKPRKMLLITLIYLIFAPSQWQYIPLWVKTLAVKDTLKLGLPWLSFGSIDFLKNIIKSNSKIFEYGSGGSTLFLSNRTSNLYSLEHDAIWYNQIKPQLVDKAKSYKLVEKQIRNSDDYFSNSLSDPRSDYSNYINEIAKYDDHFFDLVIVDGRARVECLFKAYNKVKKGGYILLDNSDRPDYYPVHMFMKSFGAEEHHFFGLTCAATSLTQTSLWKIK